MEISFFFQLGIIINVSGSLVYGTASKLGKVPLLLGGEGGSTLVNKKAYT